MGENISIVLVGIGGYGNNYVKALLSYNGNEKFQIVGVVDPKPENCNMLPEIMRLSIPIFSSLEEFYKNNTADLAIISSPIQYHCPQTCFALSKGTNVLCEKPISATVQDAQKMLDMESKSGKFVAIGYQWSHSDAIQSLKQDILKGMLGKPKRLKTIVLWPRNEEYYSRGWAGKIRDSAGNWILDSVAHNATAHYLHNMFYILGNKVDYSERPVEMVAELYRANNIENFDTAAFHIITERGVELFYYATHAVNKTLGPIFSYEFENATVVYEGKEIEALFHDGTVKNYGDPFENKIENKLWIAIKAVKGEGSILCGPESAISEVLCINGAYESVPKIINFPSELIKEEKKQNKSKVTYVKGLWDTFVDCYNKWILPGSTDVCWAKTGKNVNLKEYRYFKGIS